MARHDDSVDGADYGTTLSSAVRAGVDSALAAVDTELATRYPGEPGTPASVTSV